MKTSGNEWLGKTLYALLFLVLVPAGLVFWSRNIAHAVTLPPVQSVGWGAAMVLSGTVLMLGGMFALWHFGKGLPMNAYPPGRFVAEGMFALMPHPIYTGFVLVVFGLAVYYGHAAGFWVTGPLALAGCTALVWGYEKLDLQRRFPDAVRRYVLHLPEQTAETPGVYAVFSTYVLVLLPWFLGNAAALWAATDDALRVSMVTFEKAGWFRNGDALVVAGWIWVLAAPLAARTERTLRMFAVGGLTGGAAAIYMAFVVPVIGLGHANLQSMFWTTVFGSLPCFWIWLAARLYGRTFPAWSGLISLAALVFTLFLLLGSRDPVGHLMGSLLAGLLAFYPAELWAFLRQWAEQVANSWREWVFGPIRVINHGFYVGAAAFAGTLLGSWLAGERYAVAILVFGAIVTVCAGLWGQFIEGSDKLKRPFGFYGAMAGIALASLVMHWMGTDVWVMLGVFSVFMPWVQAIGRMRCLVNGCCHGSETRPAVGIRYVHPRSRVCFLAHLKGRPLHPTPLYSMLWLALVGGIQLRLWLAGTELSVLFGAYLMLNGLGRFVEEAYRGEPQTPVWGKLRLYQWAALVSVVAGMVISMVTTSGAVTSGGLHWPSVVLAAAMGLFVQFLMGIDFPRSNWRFSRLT